MSLFTHSIPNTMFIFPITMVLFFVDILQIMICLQLSFLGPEETSRATYSGARSSLWVKTKPFENPECEESP